MSIDHPLVRTRSHLSRVFRQKEAELLLCWPCHRKEKHLSADFPDRGDYAPDTEMRLDAFEDWLRTRAERGPLPNA